MDKSLLRATRTEKNLLSAFAGESQAISRYRFYARVANEEGYGTIARVFSQTALNEYQHARAFFAMLPGGKLEITSTYPAGVISTTEHNLVQAADGEYDEWATLYPQYAITAQEEGFIEAALLWEMIIKIELFHERRFRDLAQRLLGGSLFSLSESVTWECTKCGYQHAAAVPPERCPVCGYPKGFFKERGR